MDNEVFNPNDATVESLPIIYGFNNGGSPGFMHGALIAEDGTALGSHLCSDEGYMWGDLGVLKGTRKDRHEGFQKHYPAGYRMEFIGYPEVLTHAGLAEAIKRHREKNPQP